MRILALTLAAFGCNGDPSGPDGTVTSPEPTPEPTTPPSGLPPIADGLDARCPDVVGGPKVSPGTDMHRVTLNGLGHCNDGTPPVMFVRAATDPAHTDDWVVHFEGGGLCRDYEECAARWCGEGPIYDAGNMSSTWSPLTAAGTGIAASNPLNAFAGWTQVELHYCSSDFWIGHATDHGFDGDPPYSVRFEGDLIVSDALDALRTGAVSDDAVEALPSLADAARVVVAGSSSGGWGAILQLEHVRTALPPTAQVLDAPDSAFSPTPLVVDPERAVALEGFIEAFWRDAGDPVWNGVLPPSCQATVPETPWVCADIDYVLREHMPVPVVLHHDLYDPVLYDFVGPLGFTVDDYAVTSRDTLRYYADNLGFSVHGSACGTHTTQDGPGFPGELVTDAIAPTGAWSLHDITVAALDGDVVVAIDDPSKAGSDCLP